MAKFLKKFTELTAYTAAQSSLILPNVSLVTEGNMVKYNPTETRLIAEYNVTTISEATRILGYDYASGFSSMEIDGVEQPSISTGYTFDTTGKHVIKYTLENPTILGVNAFYGCNSLSSVTIPNSVRTIDNAAFRYNSGLTRVNSDTDGVFNIPNGVITLGIGAFRNLSGMTSVTIPDSVTTIDERCFRNNVNLTSITIPSGVTSIGYEAFVSCSGLTSITIEAVTPPTLDSRAFYSTNDCPIYVPSASVEAYKAATNLSSLASRIQAIP